MSQRTGSIVEIKVNAKNGELSDSIQDTMKSKVSKLPRFFDRTTAIQVLADLKNADSPKVEIIVSAEETNDFFDLIIVDLPDPRNVELSRLYSKEFYELCNIKLTPNGGMITQAGSPYYTPYAYLCIKKTMASASFTTLSLHNQILTMGEWGWIAGTKRKTSKEEIEKTLHKFDSNIIQTQ